MLAHAQCDCRFRSRCKQFECFNIVTSGSCSPNNLCDRTSGIRPHLCDPRRKSWRPSTKIMKRKNDSSRIQFSYAGNPSNFTRGISHRSARVISRQFNIDICRRWDRTARGAPSCDAPIKVPRSNPSTIPLWSKSAVPALPHCPNLYFRKEGNTHHLLQNH